MSVEFGTAIGSRGSAAGGSSDPSGPGTYHAHVVAACVVLLVLTVLPYMLLGAGSFVLIHDNLDSEFVYLTNLVRSGTAFEYVTDSVIPNVMGGLPRIAMRSGFDITVVLFALFDPLVAYVVNMALVRSIAFVGMLLLLRRQVFREAENSVLSLWLACLFALLPFYTVYGATVAGQPLLLYAFIEVSRGTARWWTWLVIALFPFYSLLYLSGIVILIVLGVCVLYRTFRETRVPRRALTGVLLLAAVYLAIDWPLIQSGFFDGSWTTHRVEFGQAARLGSIVERAGTLLLQGHYHAATLPTLPILVAIVLASRSVLRSPRRRLAIVLVGFAGFAVLFHAIYGPVLVHYIGDVLHVLKTVQFDRFYFLLPLCWFLLFALCLEDLRRRPALRPLVPLLILVQASLILSANTEIRSNLQIVAGEDVSPSFKEFFAPAILGSIDERIGRPKDEYAVVAIGLHPSILQYNGFHTLDAYQNNYALAYKHRFRRVIAGELRKSPELARYFDDWGSRAYVFSSELGRNFLWSKRSGKAIKNLAIDAEQLKLLGASYVISSVPVVNHEDQGMSSMGSFATRDSYWRLHLYALE